MSGRVSFFLLLRPFFSLLREVTGDRCRDYLILNHDSVAKSPDSI